MMRALLSRIGAMFRRRALEARLDEEVQSHLGELAADYVRRGMTPEEARLAARRAFGGVEQMKEAHRDRRTFGLVTDSLRDVRFGLRLLIKERWFAAVAVLVLALGIAANNTVFVLLNGFVLRELPFADPDRIVTIGTSVNGSPRPNAGVSYLDLQDWSAAQRTFDRLAGASETPMNVSDDVGVPELVLGAYISAKAFDLIGHAPSIGRGFDARDDRPGAPAVVLLSDTLWRNRYGADTTVIGRTVRVNGVPSTVIGVMAEGFAFPARSRLWQPLSLLPAETRERRDARVLQGIGRLAPEITRERAAGDLGRIAETLAAAHPDTNRTAQPRVAFFRDGVLGGRTRTTFPILLTMVLFVLLIACANVANLLLARAAYRAREIAVRLAVGASRVQIIRQLLVESVLLASLAGVVALGLTIVAIGAFWETVSQQTDGIRSGLPYWLRFEMDWRVFSFLALVCLGTGIVFGLVPAIQASRTGIVGRLVQAGTGHTGSMRQRRWNSRLVVAQLALAPMLLAGAGLMVRSIIAQQNMDAGVATDGLVRMRLVLSARAYESPEQRARFYRLLEDRLAGEQSVRATLASHAPFEGASVRQLTIDGRPVDDDGRLKGEGRSRSVINVMTVGRNYFTVLAARAIRGNTFTGADANRSVTTAIVNEEFAALYFANGDPVGHRLDVASRDGRTLSAEIVGVAPNIRQRSTEDQEDALPIVYVAYSADPIAQASILARTDVAPGAVAALISRHVRAIDPDLPLYDVMTLNDSLALSDERLGLRVFGTTITLIGAIALLLSTLGLYASTAYATAQRTREIGIRVALGSRPVQIGWLVAQRAARQLAVGLSIGMAGALGVNQLMRGVLIGVTATDLATLVGVALLLAGVTCLASAIPARRAMRLNPVAALRTE
jgi:predicted permease